MIDPDKGTKLKYSAYLQSGEILPGWVIFNEFNRILEFKPQKEDLYDNCTNSESVISSYTMFNSSTTTAIKNICKYDLSIKGFDGYEKYIYNFTV